MGRSMYVCPGWYTDDQQKTLHTLIPRLEILYNYQFSSVQSVSRVWLFVTPWIAARQASLSITISQSSLRLTSIESVMLSNNLILCHPLLLLPSIFPSIRVFTSESTLCIRWPKYWSFSFSISPSNEYSGLIAFKIDPCSPRDSQESSLAQQFKSINSLVLSLLYGPALTFVHDYFKNHSFDYIGLCWPCFLIHCLGLS